MPKTPIRVLVVDDSALIRRMICDAIEGAPGMEVAGYAACGIDALAKLDTCEPDVVTLDVQMPGMDGIETLSKILEKKPIPVIMVSSLTQRSADTTLSALEQGAVDYIAKPQNATEANTVLREQLTKKIVLSAGIDIARIMRIRKRHNSETKKTQTLAGKSNATVSDAFPNTCIALGISTGGPPALTSILGRLTTPMPPIVIVQHMPEKFTGSFAQRLNEQSELSIKEAATGDILQPNHVYVARGGHHLHLDKRGSAVKIRVAEGDPVSGHKPSIDLMMTDAANIFGDKCLGVIMTGMGFDGRDGCQAIKANGGYVIGQDEQSSDVYGMNKAAFKAGSVDKQFSLEHAPAALLAGLKHTKRQMAGSRT